MSNAIDLDLYFSRIGYEGPRTATLGVLRELHRLHPRAIPFENLDPLAGRTVSLELPAIVSKLLERRRGGYCFEQNKLFAHVLMQLGFRVTPLIARVLWGREANAVAPAAAESCAGEPGVRCASQRDATPTMPRFSSPWTAMKSPTTNGNRSHESSPIARTRTRPVAAPTIASTALPA